MPPKPKETPKKAGPTVVRQPISDSSLVYVPVDAVEGYQDRIHRCVEWTLTGSAIRHHQKLCQREDIPEVTFSEAIRRKMNQSVLSGFLNQNSTLTLQQQWEIILPMVTWDIENCGTEEMKICFKNNNNITDNMINAMKMAVKANSRKTLLKQLKTACVLRLTDCGITVLDEQILKYSHLITLNLCGNYIAEIDAALLCPLLKVLELQANRISSLDTFKELPKDLIYIGLAKNILTNEGLQVLSNFPREIAVLDLSDNEIYDLEPLLDLLVRLPNLQSLQLSGNPCSVCAAYARTVLMRLRRLKWLDNRQILPTDRSDSLDHNEPHPSDLRSAYFLFNIIRIISAPMPPKPEKGTTATFHVELELPLLDSIRRNFLMFRRFESLTEMLPLPEESEEMSVSKQTTISANESKTDYKSTLDLEASSEETDIFARLEAKNSKIIQHFIVFESNRVPWSKIMNFFEPTLKIFCPDLVALRDTFRSTITLKLIYTLHTQPPKKLDKKQSFSAMKTVPAEQRLTIATIKCSLKNPDWSQPSQHFFWDDTLNTKDAIHWGDGDLSVLQYQQVIEKKPPAKSKTDQEIPQKQLIPENLTCHFSFGIETLKTT